MKEANVQNEIMVALSQAGCIVLRNNVGGFKAADGRVVKYGVGGKGGSDLICISPTGKFMAVEVKTQTGRIRPEQLTFIAAVKAKGAIAGVCRSAQDALDLLLDG